MIRFAILTILVAALAGVARADTCPPAVELAGDPELVVAIARELAARGIAIGLAGCPSLRARVAWRGSELVVVVDNADGSASERSVSEVKTAATVIESFTRTDVAMPLLATRAIATPPAVTAIAPPILPARAPRPRFELAASLESAFANDGTTWVGGNLKICIKFGPACAAARMRSSRVIEGLGALGVERSMIELLIGVDVPIALGRMLLVPGFAGGLGGMETRASGMKRETGAFRAEVHVALAIPIVHKLALEVSLGGGLGQQTDFDRSGVMVPAEPWGLVRTGVGLRYGIR
jgi:hypothetical protein